jgi:hypothetical protein
MCNDDRATYAPHPGLSAIPHGEWTTPRLVHHRLSGVQMLQLHTFLISLRSAFMRWENAIELSAPFAPMFHDSEGFRRSLARGLGHHASLFLDEGAAACSSKESL